MIFSLAWEGRIEGSSRRQDDGKQVGHGVVVMPTNDHQEVEEGMRGQEASARNRGWPVARAPCPRPEGDPGDNECDTYVLDKMRVERAGVGHAWNSLVPGRTGEQHHQPVRQGRNCKNSCYQSLHGASFGQDEGGGLPVTGRSNKFCSHFGPKMGGWFGLIFALGNPDGSG
jgi:hypothetical protein